MLWVETPTNPTLKISDLERLGAIARKHKLISVPTTPSRRLASSGRWNWASTSSCIRPPNTSTAIPTWWVGRRWSNT